MLLVLMSQVGCCWLEFDKPRMTEDYLLTLTYVESGEKVTRGDVVVRVHYRPMFCPFIRRRFPLNAQGQTLIQTPPLSEAEKFDFITISIDYEDGEEYNPITHVWLGQSVLADDCVFETAPNVYYGGVRPTLIRTRAVKVGTSAPAQTGPVQDGR